MDLRLDDARAVAARFPLLDARDLRAPDAGELWALDVRLLPALDERDLRAVPLPELLAEPELLARDPFFEAVALERLLVVDWAMTLLCSLACSPAPTPAYPIYAHLRTLRSLADPPGRHFALAQGSQPARRDCGPAHPAPVARGPRQQAHLAREVLRRGEVDGLAEP